MKLITTSARTFSGDPVLPRLYPRSSPSMISSKGCTWKAKLSFPTTVVFFMSMEETRETACESCLSELRGFNVRYVYAEVPLLHVSEIGESLADFSRKATELIDIRHSKSICDFPLGLSSTPVI